MIPPGEGARATCPGPEWSIGVALWAVAFGALHLIRGEKLDHGVNGYGRPIADALQGVGQVVQGSAPGLPVACLVAQLRGIIDHDRGAVPQAVDVRGDCIGPYHHTGHL